MNLYEIDQAILDCIDMETGEIIDTEALEALQMQREKKIENVGLWYKDLKAEAAALGDEIDILRKRKKAAENKMESLKAYLANALQGAKFDKPRVSVSWRKSKSVEIQDEEKFIDYAQVLGDESWLRYKAPEINKIEVRKSIEKGAVIPYAELVEKNNITIS